MSAMVEIIIDKKSYEAKEGSLLIDLLIQKGIKVPYFCYHEALGAAGNCRMCMVGIKGQKRPQIACDTFVKEGMEVMTNTPEICHVRTSILELELINHPVDCPTCDQAGECSLQNFYMDYGLHDSKISVPEKVKHDKHLDLGANVMLDQERCVLCARCTRFTDEITHSHELGIVGRGDDAKVTTMPGRKLHNPYAMNVVDLCPVGALTSKDFRFTQRVWFLETTESICQGCAKGCNIYVDHNKQKYKDDIIYRFRPRRNDAINGFFICDAGRLSYKELQTNRQDRILIEHKEVAESQAIEAFHREVQHYNNITLIIDANLYCEEIEALVAFASHLGAEVYAPLAFYQDEAFGDSMLKSSNRAANAKAIELYGIKTETPQSVGLLLNFNHPQEFHADLQIDFTSHIREKSLFSFPLAASSESAGHLINEDGIKQYTKKILNKNNPLPSVIEWIERLQK